MKRAVVAAVAAITIVGVAPAISLHAAPAPSEVRATGRISKPPITWKPIPFGAKRKREMAAYSKRHYGTRTWHLRHPHVIVEHYTGSSFGSAYATFASDSPDSELHELPGTCAHFIVDADGAIYQLVNLTTRCRHTVGLNWTAVGIEHVGYSDSDILDNPRQLSASLKLTLWLTQKLGIKLRNVIGHNESLTSPYHKERYPGWRCQTHGDFNYTDMTVYRGKLRKLARRYGIDMGALPKQGHSSC